MKVLNDIAQRTLRFIGERRRAYRLAFGSVAGQAVLIDLASFCRAAEPCWHEDPRKHALLEGRREVFLRIQQHLRLSEEQLYALYAGHQFKPLTENDDADD